MQLVVHNNRTEIHGADNLLLHILSTELRYPTTLAMYQDLSIAVPSDQGWDGWVRLLHRNKGGSWFPTGLLSLVKDIGNRFNYNVSIIDKRSRPFEGFPELVTIPLRDYQQVAVKRAVAAGRGVLDLPPRSGKTRIMGEIVRQVALPTVWIGPTDRIVDQTHSVLRGFFGAGYASHLVGSTTYRDELTTPVVICTAATAVNLPAEFYESRQCIVVDEWHHGAANSYKRIFDKCDHIYYRYGMTGTFFRSGNDGMAMCSLLSETIYKITSGELLRLGFLVPTYVAFVPVIAPRLRNLDSAFQSGHGKHGIQEHVARNQLVSFCTLELYKAGRRVLILVGTKKQGRLIREILLNFLPASPSQAEFKPVEFVSTDIDRPVQGRILSSFENGQEVKILIGTSLLGEGVDLPTTDALVYARGEQAEVGLMQAMYRVGTAIASKKEAIVVDFADRHNRKLLEHSKERLRVYFQEETFKVSVLQNAEIFRTWLNSVLLLRDKTL